MRRRATALVLGLVALAVSVSLGGCRGDADVVRIGAKGFTEQVVLAEVLAGLVRAGGRDAKVVPCADTYRCQRMLRDGALDLMVDYSGTGLHYVGGPAPDRADPIGQVDALYDSLGLDWLGPLGFDNGYGLYLPASRATALGLETISDLARRPNLRIVCPESYLQRPGDGLASLVRRYGLRAAEPVAIDDAGERYAAVLSGRADVAVGYASDGELVGLGLVRLADDLAFFPPYQASVVARRAALQAAPGLEDALRKLTGQVGVAAMQQMNRAVAVEGRSPTAVALAFLVEAGLISESEPTAAAGGPELVVATFAGDPLEADVATALRAVRAVFAGRTVTLERVTDPVQAVATGAARVLVMGAERFFTVDGTAAPAREERVEAVAALGHRYVHVVRAAHSPLGPLDGRVGAAPTGSGAGRIADDLMRFEGRAPTRREEPVALLAELMAGELDAVIIVAPRGSAAVARALEGSTLRIASLAGWLSGPRAVRIPYLHHARLPAETYPGQDGPIDVLSAQVLLCGPARAPAAQGTGAGGPAAALPTAAAPLTNRDARALADATGVAEAPDPVLPSAWSVAAPPRVAEGTVLDEVLDTTLNALAVLFLIWWVRRVLEPDPAPA